MVGDWVVKEVVDLWSRRHDDDECSLGCVVRGDRSSSLLSRDIYFFGGVDVEAAEWRWRGERQNFGER